MTLRADLASGLCPPSSCQYRQPSLRILSRRWRAVPPHRKCWGLNIRQQPRPGTHVSWWMHPQLPLSSILLSHSVAHVSWHICSAKLLHSDFFLGVSRGCYSKVPRTGGLISNRNLFLIILEAGTLRSGLQHGRVLARPSFCLAVAFSLSAHLIFPRSMCIRALWCFL